HGLGFGLFHVYWRIGRRRRPGDRAGQYGRRLRDGTDDLGEFSHYAVRVSRHVRRRRRRGQRADRRRFRAETRSGGPAGLQHVPGRQRRRRGLWIAVDKAGNAYVAGTTFSTNFPARQPQQASYAGTGPQQFFKWSAGDGFVAKLNAAGSDLVYSTYLGGSQDDRI